MASGEWRVANGGQEERYVPSSLFAMCLSRFALNEGSAIFRTIDHGG
jgi:hypothetical protein